jgi:hypothetical protein
MFHLAGLAHAWLEQDRASFLLDHPTSGELVLQRVLVDLKVRIGRICWVLLVCQDWSRRKPLDRIVRIDYRWHWLLPEVVAVVAAASVSQPEIED